MAREAFNGSILEVGIVGRHEGQRTLNLLHYKAENIAAEPLDFTPRAEEFFDQLNALDGLIPRYLDCVGQDYTLSEIRLQLLSPTRYAYQVFVVNGVGSEAQESLPPNDGVTLTKKNDKVGRHNRGSIHMPAVPTTFVANGYITRAASLVYGNLSHKMIEPITLTQSPSPAMAWQPVIYNRLAPSTSPVYNQVQIQLTTRVNRRRTVGVGE